jgi:hypothetical protein
MKEYRIPKKSLVLCPIQERLLIGVLSGNPPNFWWKYLLNKNQINIKLLKNFR